MTTKSQDSFLPLSSETENKYLYSTVYEELTGNKQPGDFELEGDKEKTRRRRGCGHPYRMRLNMVDDDRRQQKTGSYAQYKSDGDSNDYNRSGRERQGRHPYRRATKLDNRKHHHSHDHFSVSESSNVRHKYSNADDATHAMPRLSASDPAEGSEQPSLEFRHEGYSSQQEVNDQQRRSRNLFPYHQRTRKKRQNNNEGTHIQQQPNGQFQKRNNGQSQRMYNEHNNAHGQGQRRLCYEKDVMSSVNNTQESFRSTRSFGGPSNFGGSSSEGAKVFYKKRRQTFSPSTRPSDR